MKYTNTPILLSLIGLLVGIVLADYHDNSLHHIFAVLCAILSSLIGMHFVIIKNPRFVWVFTVLTTLFFSTLGFLLHKRIVPANITNHYTKLDNNNTATIFLEVKELLKPSSYQDKYIANVLAIGAQHTAGRLVLNINKDSLHTNPLKIGNRHYARSIITAVPSPRNPNQFNYGAYLKRKRIHGQLSVSFKELLPSASSGSGLRVWASRFRQSLQYKLQSHSFTPDQLAIINALILGQRQGIDREMSTQYAAAGMMHILAVSGLHVGIILLLLRFITRPLGGYKLRFIRSGIIIILIWGFAILTGLSPSVLRAATMFSFLEASTLLGTKKQSSNALIASALVLLLFDPLLIYQVGFQLSYLAVMAILWIQPWLSRLLKIKNRILKKLWDAATVTTAAQLGVLPLSLFYFHQFPGLFLISNILIIPFLGILLGTGLLVVILAGLDVLPEILVKSFGSVIDGLNGFIVWIASKEAFVLQHISISLLLMLVLYVLIISTVSFLKKRNYTRLLFGLIGVLLFLATLGFEKAKEKKSQLIIFHKSRQTLIGKIVNNELKLETDDSLWDFSTDGAIKSIRDNSLITAIKTTRLTNIITFNKKSVLVVDSLGVFSLENFKPDYILLTQSPNINLERLIAHYPQTAIIADGNNYKSDIDRWTATCLKRKIPFHSTYKKGAFSIE